MGEKWEFALRLWRLYGLTLFMKIPIAKRKSSLKVKWDNIKILKHLSINSAHRNLVELAHGMAVPLHEPIEKRTSPINIIHTIKRQNVEIGRWFFIKFYIENFSWNCYYQGPLWLDNENINWIQHLAIKSINFSLYRGDTPNRIFVQAISWKC